MKDIVLKLNEGFFKNAGVDLHKIFSDIFTIEVIKEIGYKKEADRLKFAKDYEKYFNMLPVGTLITFNCINYPGEDVWILTKSLTRDIYILKESDSKFRIKARRYEGHSPKYGIPKNAIEVIMRLIDEIMYGYSGTGEYEIKVKIAYEQL